MKRAFTLIELLVVIAIIAILAAILFPVFAQAKEAAKASANLSNLKQVSLGVLQYCNDSDDAFPLAIREESVFNQKQIYPDAGGVTLDTTPAGIIPWQESIYPYTKNRDIYVSPLEGASSGTGPVKQFNQANFYGVVPRAAALAYRDANSQFALQSAQINGGTPSYLDGPFGAAAATDAATVTVNNTGSLSQSGIEHISDVIMVSDAGQFDDGFLTTTTAPTGSSTTPACSLAVTPNPRAAGAQVYVGPWARRQITGAYAGGKTCQWTQGQKGSAAYAATDGSAKTQDLSKIYETRLVGNTPVIYRMYVGATDN